MIQGYYVQTHIRDGMCGTEMVGNFRYDDLDEAFVRARREAEGIPEHFAEGSYVDVVAIRDGKLDEAPIRRYTLFDGVTA